eukprot:3156366-Karenia_brevis.AAC.1
MDACAGSRQQKTASQGPVDSLQKRWHCTGPPSSSIHIPTGAQGPLIHQWGQNTGTTGLNMGIHMVAELMIQMRDRWMIKC